jgi:hypothetical protein
MSGQMTFLHERLDVALDRVSTYPSDFGGLADCHPPMLAGEFENLDREFRQIAQNHPLALDLRLEKILPFFGGLSEST